MSVIYEVPELEECEHGVRNPKQDCVMCIENIKKAKEDKAKEKQDGDNS